VQIGHVEHAPRHNTFFLFFGQFKKTPPPPTTQQPKTKIMADSKSQKVRLAIGNVTIVGTGADSRVLETCIDGVKVVNGGFDDFTGAGLFTLTAPRGFEFQGIQATTILSANLQSVATNILTHTIQTKSLGQKVAIDYSSGSTGSAPAIGVSLNIALKRAKPCGDDVVA
jgi:hypothetical protein